ncbi:MAG: nuclear transport factor 2 family protein, partial [Pseudomonadota bacterium]
MAELDSPGQIPDPQRMADTLAIHSLLAAHCRGVDRADGDLLTACYWPDATVAYGAFNGRAHEFCGILPQAIRGYRATQHSISNCLIDFADGPAPASARSETYVTAYHYRDGDGASSAAGAAAVEMVFFGRYLDRLTRRGQEWKLQHRQVLMDWNRSGPGAFTDSGPPF